MQYFILSGKALKTARPDNDILQKWGVPELKVGLYV